MQIHEIDLSKDYDTFYNWWSVHGEMAPPQKYLPKFGIYTEDQNIKHCAAWLYMDNSTGVSWLSWLVCNPKIKPHKVLLSIKTMLNFFHIRSKELGYGVMFASTHNDKLANVYKRLGFNSAGKINHLIKELD